MAQSSSLAANNPNALAAVSPPSGALAQQSYSGTPRGPDGTTTPDDYQREMADPVRRMQIFEEMRASDHAVHAAIDARRQEINAANWVLASEDKTPLGVEILEFVEDNIYPQLDAILRLLGGGGIHYGFGAVEPVFTWADRPVAGIIGRAKTRRPARSQRRGIYLAKVAHLRQPSVETFRISEQGDLISVVQNGFTGASYRRVEIPAEKLLLWTYDQQGDDRWGVPPARHCFKAWTFKSQVEKLNLLHMDRFAVGLPIIEEGEGWTHVERQSLAAFFATMRARGDNYLLHPAGGKITLASDDGKTTLSMLEWVRYYDIAIAKTFLTQSSELGSTQTGSRSVGETMVEQMGALVQADCEELASIINEQLIKYLVDLNYGPQKSYPNFQPTQRVKLNGAMATALQSLIGVKLLNPRPEDEVLVRDVFGMPTVPLEVLQEAHGAATESTDATNAVTGAADAPAADDATVGASDQHIQVTQATVLNGAQISSAKDIVLAVAAGQLPRDAGVAMLQVFFNLTPDKAEQLMASAGTTTPTTPNPVAGAATSGADDGAGTGGSQATPPAPGTAGGTVPAPRPALVAASRAIELAVQLADGAPEPAQQGVSTYRTREFSTWEASIVRPEVLIRDLDLQAARLTGEVQDVLRTIDEDLAAQVEAHANDSAEALSAAVRTIAVPDELREQLRAVLTAAAKRARDYGTQAVKNEVDRQVGPAGVGAQRAPSLPWGDVGVAEPSTYSRIRRLIGNKLRLLAHGDDETSAEKRARDLRLSAQVDAAVESEVVRREQSVRTSILTALTQAAGAEAALLGSIVSSASKASLLGLSTGRTQQAVQSVVNVGFGIGRSDMAEAVTAPATQSGGGGGRSGIVDSAGAPIGFVRKVYSAVMDLGTCDECAKWDGAEFPIDYPEDVSGVQCPNPRCAGTEQHCRCIWIYITDKESTPLVPASKGPVPFSAEDRAALLTELRAAATAELETRMTHLAARLAPTAPAPITLNLTLEAAKPGKRSITITKPNGEVVTGSLGDGTEEGG
jgi:hypothetical protein